MNIKRKTSELNRLNQHQFQESKKWDIILILDNIRSGHNVGSFFRTADAFRISKIFLCGITAQPPQRDILKTALGATETVEWAYFKNTDSALYEAKAKGYQVIGIEQTEKSMPLNNYVPKSPMACALVFGNEVRGVQQSIINQCDLVLEIPQFGTKHSFNVSVSAGILLWHLFMHAHPIDRPNRI